MTSPWFNANWNKVLMHDYLDCFQLIHEKNLILFPGNKGSGTRGKVEPRVISDYIETCTVEYDNPISHICQAPKILGDIFESTLGALFLECGMEEWEMSRLYIVGAKRSTMVCSRKISKRE